MMPSFFAGLTFPPDTRCTVSHAWPGQDDEPDECVAAREPGGALCQPAPTHDGDLL